MYFLKQLCTGHILRKLFQLHKMELLDKDLYNLKQLRLLGLK